MQEPTCKEKSSVSCFCVALDGTKNQTSSAMLNYACEAGEAGKAGDGNRAFTAGAAAKMTRAVR